VPGGHVVLWFLTLGYDDPVNAIPDQMTRLVLYGGGYNIYNQNSGRQDKKTQNVAYKDSDVLAP
jgi:hypothetical protein